MPPTIRTIVDAAGDITAIETYQGPRGWVPITVAQEGPVIQRARAVAEAVDLDAIALAADLIGRHLAPTSDVARGAVARLEAMLAGKPARPTPDEKRRLLDEYDRATRHSYVTGGPEHLRAARAALLRALGVEA